MDVGLVTRFLFPAPTASYTEDSFGDELLWVPLARYLQTSMAPAHLTATPQDSYSFPCLLLTCRSARYLVMYFHRNGEDLGTCKDFCQHLQDQLFVHVLAVEFPGYGPLQGLKECVGPSASQAEKHAFASLAFVREALRWPLDSILLLGCSIGSCLTLSLATCVDAAGLVLVSPLLSVREVVRDGLGSLFAHFITEQFANGDTAQNVRSPTLVVHGDADKIVPMAHGERLYERLRCRKKFVSMTGAGHGTSPIRNLEYLVLPMAQFFGLPGGSSAECPQAPSWALMRDLANIHNRAVFLALPERIGSALFAGTCERAAFGKTLHDDRFTCSSDQEELDADLEFTIACACARHGISDAYSAPPDGLVARVPSTRKVNPAFPTVHRSESGCCGETLSHGCGGPVLRVCHSAPPASLRTRASPLQKPPDACVSSDFPIWGQKRPYVYMAV